MNAQYLFFIITLLVSVLAESEYKVVKETKLTASVELLLEYTGKDDYYINPKSPIIKQLNFTLKVLSFDEFSFKITDATKQRFEVPQTGVFPIDPLQNFSFPLAVSAISFEYTANPFDFRIIRKANNATLFSTYVSRFLYSDHYIQIGTQLNSQYLYGLGQRLAQGFAVKDGIWTLFNRDRGQTIDKGQGGQQTYGYYPFYLMKEKSGLFHVSYYRTSNAMDAIKTTGNTPQHIPYLIYKTIGGIVDFRFFLGDSNPQTAVQKFNFYSGRADLPPFWSFGYHQCRWGYTSFSQLERVIYNFKEYEIPLDTIWSDLDYMINSEVFTIDEQRFPLDKMADLLDEYRWIPIIDPGIKNSGYFYEQGLKRDAYIKDANTKEPFLGKMRVGRTVYPDFFHPNASRYWKDMLDILYNKVQFSGLWLDSNQFTSFCEGRCEPPSTPAVFDYGNDLPYSPGLDNVEGDMPALNSTHYNNLIQADVHIFNGYLQIYETYQYLKEKGIKPFILTRSSTVGSSRYAIHWSGDNVARWEFLRSSISDNFNNQLWGSQVVGADICGFAGNTTDELCARWYQLGSFYPFARNHNERSSIPQEPYALGPLTMRSANSNLKLRYGLLKYIYTMFVTKQGLGTIWKPLFFVFPNDPEAYLDENVQTEVMFGSDLLIAPILEEGSFDRSAYFPQGNWYDFHLGYYYQKGYSTFTNFPEERTPLFIREGSVILSQKTTFVTKTSQLGNKFVFRAGLKKDEAMSNKTTEVWTAIGNILSIQDYNNDSKIQICRSRGCHYTFNTTLYLENNHNHLKIDVTYRGQPKFNQEMQFQQFYLYFGENRFIFEANAPFQGPVQIFLEIPSGTTSLRTE